MLTRKIQLKNLSAVTAGRTTVITCPVGPRYHSVVLVAGYAIASTAAPTPLQMFGEIRCNYGGAIQRRVSGTRLDLINTAMGAEFASNQVAHRPTLAGCICLSFSANRGTRATPTATRSPGRRSRLIGTYNPAENRRRH